jgi:hypothetical protein
MPVASGAVALLALASTLRVVSGCRCSSYRTPYCSSDGYCYDSSQRDWADGSQCGGRFGSSCSLDYYCTYAAGQCTIDSGCHCASGDNKRRFTDTHTGSYCWACDSCPAHSTSRSDGLCYCDTGYSWANADHSACVRLPTNRCWDADTSSHDCTGYSSVGYTCVGRWCAAMDPGGTPFICASPAPPGYTVNPSTGRCSPPQAPSSRRRSSSSYSPPTTTPPPWPPPPPPTPRGSVSGFTLIAVAIGILSALCKFGKCILSGFKKLCACARGPELAQDENAPDLELDALPGPEASSCAQAAAAGSLPEEQATTTPVELVHRTSNPIGGGTLQQPSSIHEFLVNNDLAQYEATLSELGVTQLSHIVDVTAEDLHEFMTPHEAQQFFLSAGRATPDGASSNVEYMPETLSEGGAYTI